MGRDTSIRISGFVTIIQLLLAIGFLSIRISHGFSIQIPASRLAGLGFERSMDDSTVNKRYRQEVPLSALLQRSDLGHSNVFKRTSAATKPATCTCTCETKPLDPASAAYKRMLSSRSQRAKGSDYGSHAYRAYDNAEGLHPMKKNQKVHYETPATCTCTCETHPADEAAQAASNQGSNPKPAGSSSNHQKQEHDSIFWNDGEDYWGGDQHNGWGEKPQSAALTANNGGQHHGQEENKGEGSWGHTSRYPWKNLPDTICYREQCERDSDCCMRFNLCDRSAKVCVDCWYGVSCEDESDCCLKYPICKTESYPAHNGVQGAVVVSGKCVDKI